MKEWSGRHSVCSNPSSTRLWFTELFSSPVVAKANARVISFPSPPPTSHPPRPSAKRQQVTVHWILDLCWRVWKWARNGRTWAFVSTEGGWGQEPNGKSTESHVVGSQGSVFLRKFTIGCRSGHATMPERESSRQTHNLDSSPMSKCH